MVKKDFVCTSCNSNLIGGSSSTTFSCPNCSKLEVTRCSDCRTNSITYACESCSFEGPN